ncbi:MAG: methionine adenosyltransferase [Deltaproteobacteria bacterium]|nr:methionine adenosyltransferase [Deltaproteobacteria bacterium]
MSQNSYLFTSESVSEGHPDKVCDQIADSILDAHISQDSTARVACECLAKTGMIVLAGEITSRGSVNYDQVVRKVVREIGYTSVECGCDANTVAVLTNISQQSPDIAQGVNENEGAFSEQGAGDQGLMFGYACDDTPELMPLPIALAHRLMKKMADIRHAGKAEFLRPDSKSQVTVKYENGKPIAVDTVVISTQHDAKVDMNELKDWTIKNVINEIIPTNFLSSATRIFVNPTGRFVYGGPQADAGVTGRKIIVDSYGGTGRHGGGAFSGKDPSKVDRSAAYAARYVAKNIVAAGLASRCEIQVAYAIGVARPVSVYVDTFGTSKVDEGKIAAVANEVFSFAPKDIIKSLSLLNPIYQATASYGHFGRTPGNDGSFSWERTDLADTLKKHCS